MSCVLIVVGANTLVAQRTDSVILQAHTAYHNGRYVECSILYELAIAAGASDPVTLYNASCCLALSGRKEKALNYLEQSITQGYNRAEHMEQDSDLFSLHSDPRWKQLLKKIRPNEDAGRLKTHRDALINDLNNIAAHAYQYRIRPASMGGGGISYLGYSLPPKMVSNSNGTYAVRILSSDLVELTATSALRKGTITSRIDANGRVTDWKFTGDFKTPEE